MYFVFNCDGMSSILHIFFFPQPLHFCHGILFSIYFHVKQIVLNSHKINSFGFVLFYQPLVGIQFAFLLPPTAEKGIKYIPI